MVLSREKKEDAIKFVWSIFELLSQQQPIFAGNRHRRTAVHCNYSVISRGARQQAILKSVTPEMIALGKAQFSGRRMRWFGHSGTEPSMVIRGSIVGACAALLTMCGRFDQLPITAL